MIWATVYKTKLTNLGNISTLLQSHCSSYLEFTRCYFSECFVLYFMKLSTGKVFLNQILGPKFLRKFSNYDRGQKSKKPFLEQLSVFMSLV